MASGLCSLFFFLCCKHSVQGCTTVGVLVFGVYATQKVMATHCLWPALAVITGSSPRAARGIDHHRPNGDGATLRWAEPVGWFNRHQ
jgi:hypothetical protein